MPTYRYRAVYADGRIVTGAVAASHEQDLRRHLDNEGLELIKARAQKDQSPLLHRWSSPRVSVRMVAMICAQITDIARAGVPFVDALHDVAEGMERNGLRDALADIERALRHGSSVAESFARHPRFFPSVFTAILAAGERAGDLTETFARLTRYMEGRARFQERMRRALRYPLFLLCVTCGVFGFMMVLVVPQILSFLNTIGGEVPILTRALMAVSGFVARVWWVVVPVVGLGSLAILAARRLSSRAARGIDGALLRLPMVGILLRKIMLARFTHSFSVLFQASLDVPRSLQGARDTLGNHALVHRLDQAIRRIESGYPLSAGLADLYPPFAARILRIGEQSGHLDKSLQDITTIYDRETAELTDRILGALEPALTLMVGALLAWIVLAVLGPIYGSLSNMNVIG